MTTKNEKTKFEQIRDEDLSYLQYNYLLYLLALKKQTIVSLTIVNNPTSNSVQFIFFRGSRSGAVSTKSFHVPKGEAPFFNSWISRDFPELERTVINGKKKVVTSENQ